MILRRILPSFLSLLLSFCLPVSAAVLPDGEYLITMSESTKTVVPAGTTMRSPLALQEYTPSATWQFVHLGNNIYRINFKSMVMDSSESKIFNGVQIIIFPWHGANNQRWRVIPKGPYYSLINVHTGLAVTIPGNKRVVGNTFQGFPPNGGYAQLFDLTPKGSKLPKPRKIGAEHQEPEAVKRKPKIYY